MPKRVLSVGNCGFDHGNLSSAIHQHFQAEVIPAETADDAVAALQQNTFDIVLVNRVFDTNADSGINLIRQLTTTPQHPPLMLISNLPDAQAEARAAGAVPGFGKTQVGKPHMIEALRPFLT
jgi:two-component system, chemotaxis family, chemotaxis protein CheY